MSDQDKSSILSLAAGFLGVVGLGGFLILHHGGAAVEEPAGSYAPVDADSGLRAPARTASPSVAASGSLVSSPAPLLSDEARGESAAPAGAAASAAAGASAGSAASAAPVNGSAALGTNPEAARLVASNLAGGASASSSASASVAASSAAASSPAKPLPKADQKSFLAPKLDLTKNQGTVASTVHYGVSDRHELMGRAAGPVYNFAGQGQAGSGRVAADNAGAIRQMNAAQKQLDASDVSADEKAKLDQNLDEVRKTAASAPAEQ